MTAQKETEEKEDHKVHRERKVLLVLLGKLVSDLGGQTEMLDHLDLLESLVSREVKENRGRLVYRVFPE